MTINGNRKETEMIVILIMGIIQLTVLIIILHTCTQNKEMLTLLKLDRKNKSKCNKCKNCTNKKKINRHHTID